MQSVGTKMVEIERWTCYPLPMAKRGGAVHLATTHRHYKGQTYTTHLLRRSYRQDGKVKSETLANLSHLPPHALDALRRSLAGEQLFTPSDLLAENSQPFGHIAAVLTQCRQLGLPQLLDRTHSRQRDLVLGMIAQRVLEPASKLATTRLWRNSALAQELGLQGATEDELYAALDWLYEQQPKIEQRLAKRHLPEGGVVLYDLTSSYVEGSHCPLAAIGYSRDRKSGKAQIEYALTTDAEGRPVAIEAFAGNTGDPATVTSAVDRLRHRFELDRVVLVGDRGMLTSARVEALRKLPGVAWVSSLRAPQIAALVHSGSLQLSIFDERNLAEISDPAFPGERLVVCKNPLLAQERARKREALLEATEAKLEPVLRQVAKGRLVGESQIALRVGKVLEHYKMAKHFQLEIGERQLKVTRDQDKIAQEAALDGFYVVRTSVPQAELDAPGVVRSYKQLAHVEYAFRSLKSFDLQVRPLHHYSETRVRAHLLLCMLAYYVRWHLERAWKELLFRDPQPPLDADPVAPRRRSSEALRKASHHQLDDGTEVHSWRTLLRHLAGFSRVQISIGSGEDRACFTRFTTPTPLQARAFALAGVNLRAL